VDGRPRSQGEMRRSEILSRRDTVLVLERGETRRGAMRNRVRIRMSCALPVILSADPAARHWLLARY
jgi:hypothetical protein